MFDYFIYLVILAAGGLLGWVMRGRAERARRPQSHTYDQPSLPERGGGTYVKRQDPDQQAWVPRPQPRGGQPQPSSNLLMDIERLAVRLNSVEARVERLEDTREARSYDETGRGRSWQHDTRRRDEPRQGGQHSTSNTPRSPSASDAAVHQSYLRIFNEVPPDLPIQPVFVTLESDGGAGDIVESVRRFRQSESRHQVFVIFPNPGGGGWLYPNPRHPYTESMRYVFPGLARDNYNEVKPDINPLPVRPVGDGLWETLPG